MSAEVTSGWSRSTRLMVGLAATVIAVAGLRAVSGFASTVLLAVILVITVYPIRTWLLKIKVPSLIASIFTVLAVYAVVAAILYSLVLSVEQLINLVPQYAPQFTDLLSKGGDWLQRHGVSQEQINRGLAKLDIGQAVPVLQSLAGQVKSFLTNLLLFAMVVLFVAFDAPGFVRQVRGGVEMHAPTADALASFAHGVRRYFAVSAAFGLVCAFFNWMTLLWLGIPAAFVWALLSFVTNFIPNVGFIVGLVPPAILALLDGGVKELIIVVIAYVVINFVVQSVIQPKVVGDALGLTATISFLSLIFWAYVLGPLGAILALPMTLLAKALFIDADPQKAWLQPLLSGEKAAEDEREKVRFWKRLRSKA